MGEICMWERRGVWVWVEVAVAAVEPLTSCPHADPRSAVSSSPVTSCWSRLAEERTSSTLKEKRDGNNQFPNGDHLGHLNNCAHNINISSPALFMENELELLLLI